jgi:integrase
MARSARNASLETRTGRAKLKPRRAPYFVKIAKGLRLGYYRGASSGTWIARYYRGNGVYSTSSVGLADDLTDADNLKVFDFWQAQQSARTWGERERLVQQGIVHAGPYSVADAAKDYLQALKAEKGPAAERNAKYVIDAAIVPELGSILLETLTTERLIRWRNYHASRPKRVRTKKSASRPATRETPDDDDARRKRKASANRILTVVKALLNRAFQAGRVSSDQAWRRVKPFGKVDEAVVRYLTEVDAKRLIQCCASDFRPLPHAALLTGCRYSELRKLKISALNPDSGTLAIRLSKGKVRHVTLTEDGLALFLKWRGHKRPDEHFFHRVDGPIWGPSQQDRPIKHASREAGITPPVTFHVLRHTHASHLAMRGVPMGVIAKQLGHADTRMTEKHYAHLSPNYVAETIRANLPRFGAEPDDNLAVSVLPLRRRDRRSGAEEGPLTEASLG